MRRTLTLILALALGVSACSGGSGAEIASVGDTTITEGDLADLYEDDIDALPIDSSLRSTIFGLIAKAILIDAIRVDFGVEVDQAEVDGVEQAMLDQMNANGLTPAEYVQIPDAGPEMIRHSAEISVVREAAQRALASVPAVIDQILADATAITTVCAFHILVNTEEEATAALERVQGGEDFAAVAGEVSIDSAPGGDLGCRLANAYVEPFALATVEAPLLEPTGPVPTQFGYHVIQVNERTTADEEAVRANPQDYLSRSEIDELWTAWLTETLQDAEVELDPRYGEWTAFGILPPSE
ncbi:MAG TPA: peptidylprolyl isomerase [Acidimicrobiia bacterium]|nr:peptidylprolyl isomerase [Acidimicrobiia bacterium]